MSASRNKPMGAVPPSGNPKVPTPPIRFDPDEELSSKNIGKRDRKQGYQSSISNRPAPGKKRGFTGFLFSFLIRVFALYTIIGAIWHCGSSPFAFDYNKKDSRGLCRNLAYGKEKLVPIVTPVLRSIHQKVDPYTGPYIRATSPYTKAAWKKSKPYYNYAQKSSKALYNRHVEPTRKRYMKRSRAFTDPYIKQFNTNYKKQVKPHVDNFQKTIRPYQDIYTRDVVPYLSQAYAYSLAASQSSYGFYVDRIHPVILASLRQLHAFYVDHADPAMRRTYSLYVRPQMDRLLTKVFERKAHATGSDAIQQAKDEAKDAKKEGKQKMKEAVEKAEASARKAQEDPSVVDRIKQATDTVFRPDVTEDEIIEHAKLDAELDAELEKVKEQLEAWTSGFERLEAQEYKLFTERIAELRNRRLADLPDHFATLTETHVEDEAAAVLARLEKTFKKLSAASDSASLDDRIAEARKVTVKQQSRLDANEASLEAMVQAYADNLTSDESRALDASVAELRRFVREARKSFNRIMDEAKFEKSVEDWHGWERSLVERSNSFDEELREFVQGKKAVRSGIDAVDLRKEPKLDSHIADLRKRVKALYKTAHSQVDSYATTGVLQLRGEGALGAIGDITDKIAEQARVLSEGAATSMYAAAVGARKRLGFSKAEPEEGILAKVGDKAHSATRSVAKAAGASVTPEGVSEHAQSAYDSASSQAAGAYDAVTSQAADAYDAAATAVGVSSKPKGAAEQGQSAYESMASQLGEAYDAAADSAGDAYSSALSSAIDVGSTATSLAGSAVGAKTTPEGASEYVEYYGSAVADGASSALDAAQDSVKSASSMAASAVDAKPTPETAGEYLEHYRDAAVDSAQEAYKAVHSGVENVASASVGESIVDAVDSATSAVSEAGAKGYDQGSAQAQDMYEGVKGGVGQASDAIMEAAGLQDTEGREKDQLVGSKPDDKNFNTVGKAAKAGKDKMADRIHEDL